MTVEPPTLAGILDRMQREGWIERLSCRIGPAVQVRGAAACRGTGVVEGGYLFDSGSSTGYQGNVYPRSCHAQEPAGQGAQQPGRGSLGRISQADRKGGIVKNMSSGQRAALLVSLLWIMLSASARAQPPQIAPVVVSPIVQREVATGKTFVGTILPYKKAIIGTAVDGRVIEVLFEEGDRVEGGPAVGEIAYRHHQLGTGGRGSRTRIPSAATRGTREWNAARGHSTRRKPRCSAPKRRMKYLLARRERAERLYKSEFGGFRGKPRRNDLGGDRRRTGLSRGARQHTNLPSPGLARNRSRKPGHKSACSKHWSTSWPTRSRNIRSSLVSTVM